MNESNPDLYDRSATDWKRTEPILLSDFTARPFVLSWCEPIHGLRVLDLGCGEGYFARQLKQRGAACVEGIDSSKQMIAGALAAEQVEPLGIGYRVSDAEKLSEFHDEQFDLVVAVFLFNYVDHEKMTSIMKGIFRVLRGGGRFIFSVPHPFFAFLHEEQPPFYFRRNRTDYFSGRNQLFEGRIWRRDGTSVPVRCIHKTFDDYFNSLAAAGFTSLPAVQELLNRTGFLGDLIAWEDGVYGTSKSVFSGSARTCRPDGRGAPGGPRLRVGGAAVGGAEARLHG